jgi:L-iditol 2-dehydrogenase
LWAYRLVKPGLVEQVVAPDPGPALTEGQVRLRFLAAGLCGSDMPRFKAVAGPLYNGGGYGSAPVHEIVGEVTETAAPGFEVGDRVVGTLGRGAGLEEHMVASASRLIPAPRELTDVEAVMVQSLATVLRAAAKFPRTEGLRAAVLGAGPIGLAFCHVFRNRGVGHISLVDPIERAEMASAFGADEFHHMSSAGWLRLLRPEDRPQVVVEAVGHQQGTICDAINSVDEHGYVFGFGEPDDADYTLPYKEIYLKDVTLASGRTIEEWPEVLTAAAQYLLCHRADFAAYISHVVPVEDAQRAYSLYAKPQVGRVKVVIVPSPV